MDSTQLLGEILRKIIRNKILIIVTGIILAALLFLKAKTTKTAYVSKATVFPLTNQNENSITSSALSSLLGANSDNKSFSSEASINIIELALSRNVREAVALQPVPQKGNKTVAELLVQEENSKHSFFTKKIEWPEDSVSRAVIGGRLLMPNIAAKINKNGVLELNYSCTDLSLVKPISEIIIATISQFYINLRIAKATADYNFIIKKIDSLQSVLDNLDAAAIHMQNTTQFTPAERLQYDLPKENISDEKLRVAGERNIDIGNREEALWRLQKVTPIIATLDTPDPPYDTQKPSSIIYAIAGFLIGCILAALISISGLLYRFAKAQIHKVVSTSVEQSSL